MNHIEKLAKMTKWLVIYVCIPVALLAVVLIPTLAMSILVGLSQWQLMLPLQTLGKLIIAQPLFTVECMIILCAVNFLRNRVPLELARHRLRVDKRDRYIQTMEEKLAEQAVAFEYPKDAGSFAAWHEAAKETVWLKRLITVVLVYLWASFVLSLPDLFAVLIDWLNGPDRIGGLVVEVEGSYYAFTLMINLVVTGIRLLAAIYAQKNAPSERYLLEVTLREQKKRMEALERACSEANIPMDEIWKAVEAEKPRL